jgi:hypothetical protein
LPGFGIVTHRNLSEALSYANGLEAKRLARGQR